MTANERDGAYAGLVAVIFLCLVAGAAISVGVGYRLVPLFMSYSWAPYVGGGAFLFAYTAWIHIVFFNQESFFWRFIGKFDRMLMSAK